MIRLFVQSAEIHVRIVLWEGGRCVKVICRSMGYAHGSISSSPCSFYGGADLCGAAGTPVECLSFAIMCAALMIAFAS
jgi:hypothetical protein